MSIETRSISNTPFLLIRQAFRDDLGSVTELALLLWPEHARAVSEQEMAACLDAKDCVLFLALVGEDSAGFAMCGLRREYVEGAHSSPVGYLEGFM